jgi:hypothetical protein
MRAHAHDLTVVCFFHCTQALHSRLQSLMQMVIASRELTYRIYSLFAKTDVAHTHTWQPGF